MSQEEFDNALRTVINNLVDEAMDNFVDNFKEGFLSLTHMQLKQD